MTERDHEEWIGVWNKYEEMVDDRSLRYAKVFYEQRNKTMSLVGVMEMVEDDFLGGMECLRLALTKENVPVIKNIRIENVCSVNYLEWPEDL